MKASIRSMFVALFFSFPGVVFAQSAVTPADKDGVAIEAPANDLVSSPADALAPEKEPKRFRTWMRSTGVYERWNVRITLRSTPQRKAR
jgi:hypothetical protein